MTDEVGTEVWSAAFSKSHKARLDALAVRLATNRSSVVRFAVESMLRCFERLTQDNGHRTKGPAKA